jgi:hypothetical protein
MARRSDKEIEECVGRVQFELNGARRLLINNGRLDDPAARAALSFRRKHPGLSDRWVLFHFDDLTEKLNVVLEAVFDSKRDTLSAWNVEPDGSLRLEVMFTKGSLGSWGTAIDEEFKLLKARGRRHQLLFRS